MEELKPRGFGAMPPEKRREISRKGGLSARDQGTAHRWNSQEASAAARKGLANRWASVRAAAAQAMGDLEVGLDV